MPESADSGTANGLAPAEASPRAQASDPGRMWSGPVPSPGSPCGLAQRGKVHELIHRTPHIIGVAGGPMTATLTPVALSLVTKGRAAPMSPTRTAHVTA